MAIVAGVDFGTLSVRVTLVEPDAKAAKVYEELYGLYRELYFGFEKNDSAPVAAERILPSLRHIAAAARGNA